MSPWKIFALSGVKIQKYDITKTSNTTIPGHDLLDLELSGHAFKRFPFIEERNTSLVISVAVLTIIGIVLILFIGFIWRQNRRKRSVSANNYQAMEGQLQPATIFHPRNFSNFILAEFSRNSSQPTHNKVTNLGSDSSLLNLPEYSLDDNILLDSY